MKRRQELSDETSTINRAMDNEPVFVLLARDLCAPRVIRNWCELRIRHGLNKPGDPQIRQAMRCAAEMDGFRQWYVTQNASYNR